MQFSEVVVVATFVVLGIAVLPVARVRSMVLRLVHHLLYLFMVAAVGGAALVVFRPEWLPPDVSPAVQEVTDWAKAELPLAGQESPVIWTCLAVLVVVAGVPLLAHLDYAYHVSRRQRADRRMERTLEQVLAALLQVGVPSPVEAKPRLVPHLLGKAKPR